MSRRHANLLLIVASLLWGFGNVAQKTVLVHLDPFSAVGLRCLIGGLLVLPLVLRARDVALSPGFLPSATRVAVIFAGALIVQQAAYLTTTVTNAGFLVNIAAILTPVLAWLVLGERPGLRVWMAAGLALTGVYLLCGGVHNFGQGDLAALVSALIYAVWMLDLGRHMQAFGQPILTACLQFLVASAIALPIGGLLGTLSVETVWAAAPELAFLGLGSTALAFGFQTIAQRYTSASHAAVIVSAEGAFGAFAAAIFLGERITPLAMLGAALILVAIAHLALAGNPKHADVPVAMT